MRRRLIVNADDFGQTHGINRGVMRAFDHGIVTSASLMVRFPAAGEAAEHARARPALSVGLHLDLGEWAYEEGAWRPCYHVVDPDDPPAVLTEAIRQLEAFRDLMGRDPTHLDSHQHVHRNEPVRGVLASMGRRLGVPVRGGRGEVRYTGAFYGQTAKGEPFPGAITTAALAELLLGLPSGVTELGCHPGEDDGSPLVYRQERPREVAALCAAPVQKAIDDAGIELVSFHDLTTAPPGGGHDTHSRVAGAVA